MYVAHLDIMLQMGFSQEEIEESLIKQKYNEVMATYLLLDYRNSEVHTYINTRVVLIMIMVIHFCADVCLKILICSLTKVLTCR